MEVVTSRNGVPIRLSHERWFHIVENHDDLAGYLHGVLETIGTPDFIARGSHGALKAAKSMGSVRWMVVVYRELSRQDGFVITAYFVSGRPKGDIVWRP